MVALELPRLDLIITIGYLVSVMVVGFGVAIWRGKCGQRRVNSATTVPTGDDGNAMTEYFLGGRALPWWSMAIADLSSYLDISGTMINTALLYALGGAGIYIEIRGGVCLSLAFQLALTGKLMRRSATITKADWMRFRFGTGTGGRTARLAMAVIQLAASTVMVSYFAIGGGKFVTEFVEIPEWLGQSSDFWAAAILMVVAASYTLVTGFGGIVWVDVYQSLFIFTAFAYVGVRGMMVTLPESFSVFEPEVNGTFSKRHTTLAAWTSVLPEGTMTLPKFDSYAIYDVYWVAILFYLVKTFVQSAGGPTGGGLQTVLAQRTDRDVALQSWLATLLMAFRWMFSGAVAVLAVQYTLSDEGAHMPLDPERVVPVVAGSLPSGMRGVVVSALIAAGLTTFDTTINSASSYWTIDVYKAFISPRAGRAAQMTNAVGSSIVIMVAGLALSLYLKTINVAWGYVTMSLAGPLVWCTFLALFWSRFNGQGFTAGIIAGIVASVAQSLLGVALVGPSTEYMSFIISSGATLVVCVPVTLATMPTPGSTLRRFFLTTRPPGLWSPLSASLVGSKRAALIQQEHRADLFSVAVAVVWQMALYQGAMSVAFKAWSQAAVLGGVVAFTSVVLYLSWYRRLRNDPSSSGSSSGSSFARAESQRGPRISVPYVQSTASGNFGVVGDYGSAKGDYGHHGTPDFDNSRHLVSPVREPSGRDALLGGR